MAGVFLAVAAVLLGITSNCRAQEDICPQNIQTQLCPQQSISTLGTGRTCCTWQPQFPDNQTFFSDHTLNFTSDTDCRPLGFVAGTWYFQKPPEQYQPCAIVPCDYTSNGLCNDYAVVHVQTEGRLCAQFRVDGAPHGNRVCADSTLSLCDEIPGRRGNIVDINFFCDTGCQESSIDFWYRIITYTPAEGTDGNDLCSEQPGDYPNALLVLPPGVDPRNQNPEQQQQMDSTAARPVSFCIALPAILALTGTMLLQRWW